MNEKKEEFKAVYLPTVTQEIFESFNSAYEYLAKVYLDTINNIAEIEEKTFEAKDKNSNVNLEKIGIILDIGYDYKQNFIKVTRKVLDFIYINNSIIKTYRITEEGSKENIDVDIEENSNNISSNITILLKIYRKSIINIENEIAKLLFSININSEDLSDYIIRLHESISKYNSKSALEDNIGDEYYDEYYTVNKKAQLYNNIRLGLIELEENDLNNLNHLNDSNNKEEKKSQNSTKEPRNNSYNKRLTELFKVMKEINNSKDKIETEVFSENAEKGKEVGKSNNELLKYLFVNDIFKKVEKRYVEKNINKKVKAVVDFYSDSSDSNEISELKNAEHILNDFNLPNANKNKNKNQNQNKNKKENHKLSNSLDLLKELAKEIKDTISPYKERYIRKIFDEIKDVIKPEESYESFSEKYILDDELLYMSENILEYKAEKFLKPKPSAQKRKQDSLDSDVYKNAQRYNIDNIKDKLSKLKIVKAIGIELNKDESYENNDILNEGNFYINKNGINKSYAAPFGNGHIMLQKSSINEFIHELGHYLDYLISSDYISYKKPIVINELFGQMLEIDYIKTIIKEEGISKEERMSEIVRYIIYLNDRIVRDIKIIEINDKLLELAKKAKKKDLESISDLEIESFIKKLNYEEKLQIINYDFTRSPYNLIKYIITWYMAVNLYIRIEKNSLYMNKYINSMKLKYFKEPNEMLEYLDFNIFSKDSKKTYIKELKKYLKMLDN